MDRVVVSGVEIACQVSGEGEPVVLVGGSGMPAGAWELSFAPSLRAAGYRVVTFDARGVGESTAPEPPYTVGDLAVDTIGVIERVAGGPCALVGVSLGGFVAEEVCWRRPDLVRAAALVASTGRTTAFMREKMKAEAELFDGPRPVPAAYDRIDALTVTLPVKVLQDDDVTVAQWAELLALTGFPTEAGRLGQAAAARDWLLDDARCDRWPRMRVPALVIAFEHDLQFPPSRAREAAAAWPGARYAEIAGVAHGNGMFDAAAQIGEQITGFLAEHP